MADYIKTINVDGSSKRFDYESLANLPEIPAPLSDTDGGYGQRIKALEDKLKTILGN